MIADGARGGVPEFFWLTPTVRSAPIVSGITDANALPDLTVEVCVLDAGGGCVGSPIQELTATSLPMPSRLSYSATAEAYEVTWLTGPSRVKAGTNYRVSVRRDTLALGTLDVAMVRNTPALAGVDTARFVGLVKGQQQPIRFRLELPDVRNHVRVNEVESNQGTPGDWVEFFNTSARALDLSGLVFRDNNDSRGYSLPTGTTIPAGGFLVLDEATFGFGLGATDMARLFAADGTTLIDSHSWSGGHAPTTFGRCPDGTGEFTTTSQVTKGGANDCSPLVRINEIESSGGTPGDWVELINNGPAVVDLSGYVFRDNNDTRGYTIPLGTTIAPGGYLVLDEAQFGFGLGSADAARLFVPGGVTLLDSHSWAEHAATTLGRCPNGTGAFMTTASITKGSLNDCGAPAVTVKLNEIESSGGIPGDWVELINLGNTPVDLSGYFFRDNDDTRTFTLPAGSIIAPGGYLVLDEAQFGFGLGSADAARLFAPDGVTLLDSHSWTEHAATTLGRCPNGTGAFVTTQVVTKGGVNACVGDLVVSPWPGDGDVFNGDGGNLFGGNMSGLSYAGSGTSAPGVLWGARNGPGAVFRLLWSGTSWLPDPANDWSNGKALRYPDGTGDVDAEGIVVIGNNIFVASERNNASNGISRNSVLRYDVLGAGSTLIAITEWKLTADLPVVGANLGLEAITFIPDNDLVATGFIDQTTNTPYTPATYPNHGEGLFFVALEANGIIYAYALNQVDGSFTRVATITSGFAGVMDLEFDRERQLLWAICDNTCEGRSAILRVDADAASATAGQFVVVERFERPAGMPNLNNEGFTVATQLECVGGRKPAYWADDSETGGFAIRRGMVSCTL
ncbi:MAG: lamin tail domain-containing protein [Gemmatimonadales bacterium]|nr:lamin tail domain-containing protein [Gemmatimonadales bacterium]